MTAGLEGSERDIVGSLIFGKYLARPGASNKNPVIVKPRARPMSVASNASLFMQINLSQFIISNEGRNVAEIFEMLISISEFDIKSKRTRNGYNLFRTFIVQTAR